MAKLIPRPQTICTPYGTWNNSGSSGPPTIIAPAISVQPTSQTVTAPATATFSVTATGTAPLSYQWYQNGKPVGGNSNSYTTGATDTSQSGQGVYVVVSNGAGAVTSTVAILTVNSGSSPTAPAITTQPNSISTVEASTATYTMTAQASGFPAPTWQWFEDSSATPTVPLATTSFITVNGNQLIFNMANHPSLGGVTLQRTYHAVATNASGSATSSTATVTITPSGTSANVSAGVGVFHFVGIQPIVSTGTSTMVIKRGTTFTYTLTGGVNYTQQVDVPRILSGTGTPVTLKLECYNSNGTLAYTFTGWPTGFVFSAPPTMWIFIDSIALPQGQDINGAPVDASMTIEVYEGSTLKGSQSWTSSNLGAWLASHPAGGLRFLTYTCSSTIPANLKVVVTINGKFFDSGGLGNVAFLDSYITFSSTGIYLQGAP